MRSIRSYQDNVGGSVFDWASKKDDEETYPDIQSLLEENRKLKERCSELTKHIVVLTDDSWPYLHQWCTIKSIKARWHRAREYINEGTK